MYVMYRVEPAEYVIRFLMAVTGIREYLYNT